MEDIDSLEFQWAGIDFRLQPRPRPGAMSDAPVLLHWRCPSGEAGSRRFARVSDAMRHSSSMTEAMAAERRFQA